MKIKKSTTFVASAFVALLLLTGCSSNTATMPGDSSNGSTEQKPAEDKPKGPDGTRANPYPIGTTVENDEWAVTINSVTFGANDVVAAENQFNDAPEAGNEYMLINVTMTYKSDDSDGGMPAFVSIEYVTPSGATVDSFGSFAVAPDKLDSMSTLYKGGSTTGNIVIEVPSENASAGVIMVRPGMLADKSFIAAK